MAAQLERLNREIEALAPQIEAAFAVAQQPGASPLAAKHYDNLVEEKKQLIACRDTLQVQLLSAAAAAAGGGGFDDLVAGRSGTRDILLDIQRKVTESSMATRHASTISVQDLETLEAALRITFVCVDSDALDPDISASMVEPVEFTWEQNKHEAKQKQEYLDQLQKQINIPSHLRWSLNTDKANILKTGVHCGGASLPFSIGCKTDAMVFAAKSKLAEEGAIVATVELKKKVVAQSLRQTKVTFLCASLKSQLPVVACCTDMGKAAVAYYTNGQRRLDGCCVVYERCFSSCGAMCEFLRAALSAESVAPNVLLFEGDHVVLPAELPNPKRMRVPVPAPPPLQPGELAKMLAGVLAGGDDDDVACMRDVEEGLTYFS